MTQYQIIIVSVRRPSWIDNGYFLTLYSTYANDHLYQFWCFYHKRSTCFFAPIDCTHSVRRVINPYRIQSDQALKLADFGKHGGLLLTKINIYQNIYEKKKIRLLSIYNGAFGEAVTIIEFLYRRLKNK